MIIDTKRLRRLNKLPIALGVLECPKEGGPIRFAQMRTVVDCGIEVWGQKQIDEHTENLWATIDAQSAETARLREALRWAAGTLQAACRNTCRIDEADKITIANETKVVGQILDAANAALEQEQGGNDASN